MTKRWLKKEKTKRIPVVLTVRFTWYPATLELEEVTTTVQEYSMYKRQERLMENQKNLGVLTSTGTRESLTLRERADFYSTQ
jgi:hypothetical protein